MPDYYSNIVQFKKYTIFYRIYNKNTTSNTGILFFHGKASHSEYINNIIDSRTDFKIFAFDYPGQGRSSGKKGHCDIYKVVPEITAFIANTIIKKHSITILFLAGESLGALICFYVYSKKLIPDIKINGLIFMPGVYAVKDFSNKPKLLLLYILNLLIPWFRIKNKRPLSAYTDKKKKLDALKNDNYLSSSHSVKYLYGIYKFFHYFQHYFSLLKIPVLIFQGKLDYHSTVKDFGNFYNLVHQTAQNKLVYLAKSRHWLLLGEETDTIKDELYNWIKNINR